MKTNPNDAAFANSAGYYGLTKMEYFSAIALQGILSKPILIISAGNETAEKFKITQAKDAILSAKALIDELNKVGNNE